jgi:hypothetical protein
MILIQNQWNSRLKSKLGSDKMHVESGLYLFLLVLFTSLIPWDIDHHHQQKNFAGSYKLLHMKVRPLLSSGLTNHMMNRSLYIYMHVIVTKVCRYYCK